LNKQNQDLAGIKGLKGGENYSRANPAEAKKHPDVK